MFTRLEVFEMGTFDDFQEINEIIYDVYGMSIHEHQKLNQFLPKDLINCLSTESKIHCTCTSSKTIIRRIYII